jgi:hypothetical protein
VIAVQLNYPCAVICLIKMEPKILAYFDWDNQSICHLSVVFLGRQKLTHFLLFSVIEYRMFGLV